MRDNPCVTCGACCAHFRVSFYWAEADDAPGGTVPTALTEDITSLLRCMKGTNQREPRCAALEGEIGREVRCGIYERRPGPCHELEAGSDACNRARRRHGLAPLD